MATWPATLPAPENNGYGITPLEQVIATDMEVGPRRTRRRTKARNDKIALSWLFTDAQLHTFRGWFDDDVTGIAGGDAWFTVDLAVGGATLLESVEAKFVGVAKPVRDKAFWRVSAVVEVR